MLQPPGLQQGQQASTATADAGHFSAAEDIHLITNLVAIWPSLDFRGQFSSGRRYSKLQEERYAAKPFFSPKRWPQTPPRRQQEHCPASRTLPVKRYTCRHLHFFDGAAAARNALDVTAPTAAAAHHSELASGPAVLKWIAAAAAGNRDSIQVLDGKRSRCSGRWSCKKGNFNAARVSNFRDKSCYRDFSRSALSLVGRNGELTARDHRTQDLPARLAAVLASAARSAVTAATHRRQRARGAPLSLGPEAQAIAADHLHPLLSYSAAVSRARPFLLGA